jgi:hypothetical protein
MERFVNNGSTKRFMGSGEFSSYGLLEAILLFARFMTFCILGTQYACQVLHVSHFERWFLSIFGPFLLLVLMKFVGL